MLSQLCQSDRNKDEVCKDSDWEHTKADAALGELGGREVAPPEGTCGAVYLHTARL